MNPTEFITHILYEKWAEHIEMADDKSAFLCRILAFELSKQMQEVEYLKKRIKTYERYSVPQV